MNEATRWRYALAERIAAKRRPVRDAPPGSLPP